jgi:hypothetical protein
MERTATAAIAVVFIKLNIINSPFRCYAPETGVRFRSALKRLCGTAGVSTLMETIFAINWPEFKAFDERN